MTTLTFPTMAEQALAEWNEKHILGGVGLIAKRHGADVERRWEGQLLIIEYTFDDDTSLRTSGRGKAHRVEAMLP